MMMLMVVVVAVIRSAEGAFDLVQNFRNIQSRESINQQVGPGVGHISESTLTKSH